MKGLKLKSEITVGVALGERPTESKIEISAFSDVYEGDFAELQRLLAILMLSVLPAAGVTEAYESIKDIREYYALESPRPSLPEVSAVETGKVVEFERVAGISFEE